MKIFVNTEVESYGHPRFIIEYLEKMGIRDKNDESPDIVFNIDYCSTFRKGNYCTVYLEGDEYTTQGYNKDRYAQSDIFYIVQENYLGYYPSKTKVLRTGVNPALHYPRNIEKKYEYVFVGKTNGNSVYDHRREVLSEMQKSSHSILVTDGTQDTYCDLMSSGRIILNIMPRNGPDACANFRILEGMAIGCVMTDYDISLEYWGIKPNVHYLPIERFGEDISDEEIQRIHETGMKYAYENFSYKDAVSRIVKDIENFLIDNIKHEEVK